MQRRQERRQLHDGGEAEVEHEQLQQQRRAANDLDPGRQRRLQRARAVDAAARDQRRRRATASAIERHDSTSVMPRGAQQRRQVARVPPPTPTRRRVARGRTAPTG